METESREAVGSCTQACRDEHGVPKAKAVLMALVTTRRSSSALCQKNLSVAWQGTPVTSQLHLTDWLENMSLNPA